MLLYLACFFVVSRNYGWVASSPIEHTTCHSGHELLQQMTDISNKLKSNETFIDLDLTNVVHDLSESIDAAPPQLTTALNELKEVASRYIALAAQMNLNAVSAKSNSTRIFVSSNRLMSEALEQNPGYFDDPIILTAACALIDSARNATSNFTEKIAGHYKKLKSTLMPNEDEMIAAFAVLIRKLNEATPHDFDAFADSILALIKEIQTESDRIEQNIYWETISLRDSSENAASDLEWKLYYLSNGIYALLPESLDIYLEPQCDSPQYLQRRLYKVIEDLSTADNIGDIVPKMFSDNIEDHELSSGNMPSGPLTDALNISRSTAIKYSEMVDSVVNDATSKIQDVTRKNIHNDFELIQLVDNHLEKFEEENLLIAACDVIDAARKITGKYKLDAMLLFAKFKDTVIPNAEHLKDILLILIKELELRQSGKSEKCAGELLQMNEELQTAYKHIQKTAIVHFDELEKGLTVFAVSTDTALKNLVDELSLRMRVNVGTE